ncbi:MAG TPA: hypothetical protein VEU74_09150 [Gemmatimonadales bacterium]|nr:hypothetical protein [Gemmatimonadales bacterium]
MSEHDEGRGGSTFGPFLLGVSLGAVLGFLFAPEPGEVARGRLSRRLRGLRDLAAEKAGEIGDLLHRVEEADEEPPATTRAALERRLGDAKRRRRGTRPGRGGGGTLPRPDEGDEPVA